VAKDNRARTLEVVGRVVTFNQVCSAPFFPAATVGGKADLDPSAQDHGVDLKVDVGLAGVLSVHTLLTTADVSADGSAAPHSALLG
jgi:hypothetical protein